MSEKLHIYKKLSKYIDAKMFIAFIFMILYSIISHFIIIPQYVPIFLIIAAFIYVIVISDTVFTNRAKELVSLIIFIAVIYVMYQLINGLNGKYIIIEPFDVTANLASDGYTGKVVANRLISEIESIRLKSGLNVDNKIINLASTTPDLIIPGSTNTMRSLILSFREIFSRPMFEITGDIVSNDRKLVLLLR